MRKTKKRKKIISVVEQIAGTIPQSQHGLQGGAIFLNISQYLSIFLNIDCKVDQYFVVIVHLFIHIKLNISPVDFLYTLLWSERSTLGQHYYLNHALFSRF